jgi:serine/threonine protein kinase
MFSKMLSNFGHELTKCYNGADVLEIVKKERFDVIVLDNMIPEVDGYTICSELRSMPETADIPIIIISKDDSESSILKFLNAGADDYIVKPIKELVFIAKLNKFLHIHALNEDAFNLAKNNNIIADRYRMKKIIGYGMHSCVFLAEDTQNKNSELVVKLFNSSMTSEALMIKIREKAELLMEKQPENMVRILDVGVYDNVLYIAQDFARNGTLATLYKAKGNLSEEEIAKIGYDISKAICSLQESGLQHLDINPNNIVIDGETYLLTDFGFTPDLEAPDDEFRIWADPAYIPPEMIIKDMGEISYKSEVYSLGVTLYEGLVGDNPFIAKKPAVTKFRQLNLVPSPLIDMSGLFSVELSILIDSMLAKQPEHRPEPQDMLKTFKYIVDVLKSDDEEESALTYAHQTIKSIEETSVFSAPEDVEEKTQQAVEAVEKKANVKLKPRTNYSRLRSHKKITIEKNKLYITLLCICVFLLLFIAANSISRYLFYNKPAYDFQGPKLVVTCDACQLTEVRPVLNIEKMKCSRCGGKIHFTRLCNKCNRIFPYRDDIFDFDKIKSEYDYDEVFRCPFCKSKDTKEISVKEYEIWKKLKEKAEKKK